MASVGIAEVKRLVDLARATNQLKPLSDAVTLLKEIQEGREDADPISTPALGAELFILCCEEAIAQEQWDIAAEMLLHFTGKPTASPILDARALLCEAQVECSRMPDGLRLETFLEQRQCCAAIAMRGIATAIENWPCDSWVVVRGIDTLWTVLRPLYVIGQHHVLVDAFAFVVSLVEKLAIGGPYCLLQWSYRYAISLRALGRYSEALNVLDTLMDIANRMESERLRIQVYRVYVITVAEKEYGAGSGTGKTAKLDTASAKQLLQQATQMSQLYLCGYLDAAAVRADLLAICDKLVAASAGTAGSQVGANPGIVGAAAGFAADKDAVTSNAGSGSTKGAKGKAAKQQQQQHQNEPATPGDPDVVLEVLGEVLLCLATMNEKAKCATVLPLVLRSANIRARTFALYAQTVLAAHESNAFDFRDALDASYMTPAIEKVLFSSIRELERAMDSARFITDVSDRSHALGVGCTLLWNFCLPLLQERTHPLIRDTIVRVARQLSENESTLVGFHVRALYESAVAEYEDDNLSLVSRIISTALSKGYSIPREDGTRAHPMDFRLLWLQRRCRIRMEPDATALKTNEESVLYNVEQAKLVSTSSKRLALLKAAFSKLPQLSRHGGGGGTGGVTVVGSASDEQQSQAAGGEKTPGAMGASGLSQITKGSGRRSKAGLPLVTKRPPKRSAVELYYALMNECARDPMPTITPMLKAVATSLTLMELEEVPANYEFLLIKGEAHLMLANVLIDEQVETALPSSTGKTVGDPTDTADTAAAATASTSDRKEPGPGKTSARTGTKADSGSHKTGAAGGPAASTTTAPNAADVAIAGHMKAAADLGVSAQSLGFSTAWLTVNACQAFLNWHSSKFACGIFAPAAKDLCDLYSALSSLDLDRNKEWRMCSDMALVTVLALCQSFMIEKGDTLPLAPTGGAGLVSSPITTATTATTTTGAKSVNRNTSVVSVGGAGGLGGTVASTSSSASWGLSELTGPKTGFEDFIKRLAAFPKGESTNANLKKSHEIASETLRLIHLPSHRASVTELYPTVCRLSGGKPEVASHPQDQLLMLLGRMRGPMPKEERRALLRKEALEYLEADPSVELCGRVAAVAVEMGEERTVLRVCQLADQLYAAGKLGWGTLTRRDSSSGGASAGGAGSGGDGTRSTTSSGRRTAGGGASSATASASQQQQQQQQQLNADGTAAAAVVFPKPNAQDWFWYGKLLLQQADVYYRRCLLVEAESRAKLGLKVLQLCCNAAISASHGPQRTRAPQVTRTITLFFSMVGKLWKGTVDRSLLIPYLQMMLSPHVLAQLNLSAQSRRADTERQSDLIGCLTGMGYYLLQACAAAGRYQEGMNGLASLQQILPAREHKGLKVLEAEFRCELGIPIDSLVRSAKADGPETESLVWISVAKHSKDRGLTQRAWKSALEVVENNAFAKANCLLEMVTSYATKSDSFSHGTLRLMLMSVVDMVEGFSASVSDREGPTGAGPNGATMALTSAGLTGAVSTATIGARAARTVSRQQRTLPNALGGSLTARTLVITNGSAASPSALEGTSAAARSRGATAVSRKPAPVAQIRDLLLLVRALYVLFCCSPEHPLTDQDGDASQVVPTSRDDLGADDKTSTTESSTKLEAAIVMVWYVDCLWRVVRHQLQNDREESPSSVNSKGTAGSEMGAQQTQHTGPNTAICLELPQNYNEWFGFTFPTEAADVIRRRNRSDARFNSETVQGMLLQVADFLIDSGYEQYSFILLSWVDFAACWRYGASDFRTEITRSVIRLKTQQIIARCQGGCALAAYYAVPPLTAPVYATVEETLREIHEVVKPLPATLVFSPLVGSLPDTLICLAESLTECGRHAEALRIVEVVYPCAVRAGDADAVARCHLQQFHSWTHNGLLEDGLAYLEAREREGALNSVSAALWLRWFKTKVSATLCHIRCWKCSPEDAAASLAPSTEQLVGRVIQSLQHVSRQLRSTSFLKTTGEFNSVLRRTVLHDLTMDFHRFTADVSLALLLFQQRKNFETAAATVSAPVSTVFRNGALPASLTTTSEMVNVLNSFVEQSCTALRTAATAASTQGQMAWKHYAVLATASHAATAQSLTMAREVYGGDEEAYMRGWKDEELSRVTAQLAASAAKIDEALTSVRAVMERTPFLSSTVEFRMLPYLSSVEAELLTMWVRNTEERVRIMDFAVQKYRSLGMEELGLPRTNGAPANEQHVLDFMRDPTTAATAFGGDGCSRALQMQWSLAAATLSEEVKNALAYYRISLEDVDKVNRFALRAYSHAALELARTSACTAFYSASLSYVDVHYHYLLDCNTGGGVLARTGKTENGAGGADKEDTHSSAVPNAESAATSGHDPREAAPDRRSNPARRRSTLQDLWARFAPNGNTPAIPAVHASGKDRQGNRSNQDRGRGASKKDVNASTEGEESETELLPALLHEEDAAVLDQLLGVVTEAERRLDYHTVHRCLCLAADLYVLWRRPRSAALAVEFAVAARCAAVVCDSVLPMMENTAEKRAWVNVSAMTGTSVWSNPRVSSSAFDECRAELRRRSPMLEALELAPHWPRHPELPSSQLAFLSASGDAAFLSITRASPTSDVFFAVFRYPDGSLDIARCSLNLRTLSTIKERVASTEEEFQRALGSVSSADAANNSKWLSPDTASLLTELEELLSPILKPLTSLAPGNAKTALYLCVDDAFDGLPLEQLPSFSSFHAVQRELSVLSAVRKMAQSKSSKSGAAATLYVVDPFGDSPSSVEAAIGGEGKNKAPQGGNVLTSENGLLGFSADYLSWALESKQYHTLVISMCGAVAHLLSPSLVATTNFGSIHTAILVTDGTNHASLKRDQKRLLMTGAAERGATTSRAEKDAIIRLLLARGVRCVVTNTFASTPVANDGLCRKLQTAISSGKGMAELTSANASGGSNTKSKEPKKVVITISGVFTVVSKNK